MTKIAFFKTMAYSFVLASACANATCFSYPKTGFTIAPRSSAEQTYECTDRYYPYFNQMNYVIEQGINCSNEQWPGKVVMNCENRSHNDRDVKNVALLCCDMPSR